MKDTIRKCCKCGYETIRINDDEREHSCPVPLCHGKLEIIARGTPSRIGYRRSR